MIVCGRGQTVVESQDNDDNGLLTSPVLCPQGGEFAFELAESRDGGVVINEGLGSGGGFEGTES